MYELIWHQGALSTRSGRLLMMGTLTECAEEFPGVVIMYVGL